MMQQVLFYMHQFFFTTTHCIVSMYKVLSPARTLLDLFTNYGLLPGHAQISSQRSLIEASIEIIKYRAFLESLCNGLLFWIWH